MGLADVLNDRQKAVASAVVGFITGFLSTLVGAMTITGTFADLKPVTWLIAILAGLGGLGLGGVTTFRTTNRPTGRHAAD